MQLLLCKFTIHDVPTSFPVRLQHKPIRLLLSLLPNSCCLRVTQSVQTPQSYTIGTIANTNEGMLAPKSCQHSRSCHKAKVMYFLHIFA